MSAIWCGDNIKAGEYLSSYYVRMFGTLPRSPQEYASLLIRFSNFWAEIADEGVKFHGEFPDDHSVWLPMMNIIVSFNMAMILIWVRDLLEDRKFEFDEFVSAFFDQLHEESCEYFGFDPDIQQKGGICLTEVTTRCSG